MTATCHAKALIAVLTALFVSVLSDPVPSNEVSSQPKSRNRRENRPECFRYNDPDRYDEITLALSGYHITEGDPLNWSNAPHDEGFRQQIFSANVPYDEEGKKFALHSGITYADLGNCMSDIKTKVFSNLRQFHDSLVEETSSSQSNSFDVAVNIPFHIDPLEFSPKLKFGFDIRYSESDTMKKLRQSISKDHGVITVNSATCFQSSVTINAWDMPKFQTGFARVIEKLARARGNERDTLFQKFIKAYGTHFIKKAYIGSSFRHIRTYKASLRQDKSRDDTKKCSQNSTRITILNFDHERENAECSASERAKFNSNEGYLSTEKIISVGSKPIANNAIDWARQDFLSPVPLKMEHEPIVNLFEDDILLKQQALNLTSDETAELRDWIVPKYRNYFNGKKTEINKILPSGCGFTDTCEFKQICRDLVGEGASVCETRTTPAPTPWNECVVKTSPMKRVDGLTAGETVLASSSDFATSVYGPGFFSARSRFVFDSSMLDRGHEYNAVRFAAHRAFNVGSGEYWCSYTKVETDSLAFQGCRPLAVRQAEFQTYYKMNLDQVRFFGLPCVSSQIQFGSHLSSASHDCEWEEIVIKNLGHSFDSYELKFSVENPKLFWAHKFEMNKENTYSTMYGLKLWEQSCDEIPINHPKVSYWIYRACSNINFNTEKVLFANGSFT